MELPDVLTYDEISNTNKFVSLSNIEIHKNVDIYKVSFSDQILAKTFNVTCDIDTEFLLYNIILTSVEPIMRNAFNVYHYLKYNKEHYSLVWKPLSFMMNYAVTSPALCLGDMVVKFLERKLLIKDTCYSINTKEDKFPR
jgi:hypothetical protein